MSSDTNRTTYNRMDIRKIIAVVLLLTAAGLLFMFINEFSEFRAFYPDGSKAKIFDEDFKVRTGETPAALTGNEVIRQEFTAESSTISSVKVVFDCLNNDNRSGTISVEIADKDGRVLASDEVAAESVVKRTLVDFAFNKASGGICRVTAGEKYEIVISAHDLSTDAFFGVHTVKSGETLYAVLVYSMLKAKVAAVYLAIILLSMLLVLTLAGRRFTRSGASGRREKKSTYTLDNAALRVMFILTPVLDFIMVSKITGRTYGECVRNLFTYAGAMNLMVIGFIWWLIYALTGRKKAAVIISTAFNMGFSLIHFALIQFRGVPLLFNDISEWKTAAMVAGNYRFTPDRHAVALIVISLVWIALAVAFREGERLKGRARIALLLAAAAWCGLLYYQVFATDNLRNHHITVSGWKPEDAYYNNGYYISFVLSIRQAVIEKPEGYSADRVAELASRYESDEAEPAGSVTEKTPNIIVIMNESFSDLEVFGDIETDKEVLPFFSSLEENVIKGTMHSSIYGGSTAVSEFECLTGCTERFIPANTIPYTSIVKREIPSLAWELKSRSYGGITAFHPGYATSYRRNKAYPLLGFDKHISSESLDAPLRIRSFISDEEDYNKLISEYEEFRKTDKNTPYFMFNVTIQNHGGFTLDTGEVEPHQINILDNELEYEELGQFLDLMKISDQELEKLIGYFSKTDEPTVIMLFGDHQPRVEEGFYETMYSRQSGLADLEKADMRYRVPFMIWANYDIPEREGIEISANFLQTLLLDTIGAPLTGFQKYQLDLMEQVPVLSKQITIGKDGKLYSPDEETPYDDIINEYSILQYNMLADHRHTDQEFFNLK